MSPMTCMTSREIDMTNARRSFVPPLLTVAALAVSPAAWAHSGHGLGDGTHWHATDAWGLALVLALGAAALWLGRRK